MDNRFLDIQVIFSWNGKITSPKILVKFSQSISDNHTVRKCIKTLKQSAWKI